MSSQFLVRALLIMSTLCFIHAVGANEQGKQLFEQRCHKCHDLPDPGKPPPMGWEKRLVIMSKLAKLTPDEKQNVLGFLQSHTTRASKTVTLAEERKLFEQKCSLCHTLDRVYLIPLNKESRSHIVKRMRGKVPGWITDEEADQILDYLARAPKVVRKKTATGESAEIFRERCSACHSLERVYAKINRDKAESWVHIVRRMKEKAPEWLTRDDAEQIMKYLRSISSAQK